MKQELNTALLIFTRSARQEAIFKHFAAQNYQTINKVVAQKLINQVKNLTSNFDSDVIWWDSSLQRGNSFKEKLHHAFSYLFDSGYHHVIAIGNDCPELTVSDLRIAKDKIKNHDFVIGPAKDGGVYLMGINKKMFSEAFFNAVHWGTSSVFSDIHHYIMLSGSTFALLSTKKDADNYHDLVEIICSNRLIKALSNELNELINRFRSFFLYTIILIFSNSVASSIQLRAPPCIYW